MNEGNLAQLKRIGVVGGGIAGLTTAFRLAKSGQRVTLWERGSRLGGQAAAFPVTGNSLEYFYHHLFQSDREIVALIEELGISDHLLWLPSNVGYFANGKIYPLNGARDLLKLDVLPFHDRVRLGLVTAYLQRVKRLQGEGMVPGYPTLNVIGLGPERRGLLYHRLYSSSAPDFVSAPAEVRTAIRSVGAALAEPMATGADVTAIIDSGLDDQAIWGEIWDQGWSLVGRICHDTRLVRPAPAAPLVPSAT